MEASLYVGGEEGRKEQLIMLVFLSDSFQFMCVLVLQVNCYFSFF